MGHARFQHPTGGILIGTALDALMNYVAENDPFVFTALVVARVKDGVVNEIVRQGFRHCVVDIRSQREIFLIKIFPIVIAAPITVEVKIRYVIAAWILAQGLVENGCKTCGDFIIVVARLLCTCGYTTTQSRER